MPTAEPMPAMSRCATPEAGQLEVPFVVVLVARSLVALWEGEGVLDGAQRLAQRLARFPEGCSAVSATMLCIVTACAELFAIDLKSTDKETDP